MSAYSDELRLVWLVALNVGLFAAAYRFARQRGSTGRLQAICDAFLLYFFVQYAAVALPGVIGQFSALTMSALAAAAASVLWLSAGKSGNAFPSADEMPHATSNLTDSLDHVALIAATLFVAGFLLRYAVRQWPIPPVATDSLVYHLPTAVQWMQTGRLGIYPTWYWNPAASYSPATSSTFMAWWMAPVQSDVFVRFVQLPPLMFIFFLVARMCRLVGCTRTIGGLIAIGATLSRPLFSEAVFPKDDLYVTSFIAAGILTLASEPMKDRFGSWRVGMAIGFVLASKYTALLACPVFLFMIDSPLRAHWRLRHWLAALGCIAAMALPWYVRNIMLTRNPLYPVDVHFLGIKFAGLFGVERDQQLRSVSGIWSMLATTYHSMPMPLIVALCGEWIAAVILSRRRILHDPLVRAATIGSAATLIVFLITSPHHEVRYLFPLIVLWFVAAGLALATAGRFRAASIVAAGIIAAISVFAVLDYHLIMITLLFAGWGTTLAIVGLALIWLYQIFVCQDRGRRTLVMALAAMIFGVVVYIHWHASLAQYEHDRFISWKSPGGYPDTAPIWTLVNDSVPADATIAYANTFFVYPLYGEHFTRRVIYAPTRKDLHDFSHFPRMGDRVPGDLIVARMTEVMNEDADLKTWLANLHDAGAEYLVIVHDDALSTHPPELDFAKSNPAHFTLIGHNDAGMLFKIR